MKKALKYISLVGLFGWGIVFVISIIAICHIVSLETVYNVLVPIIILSQGIVLYDYEYNK